MERTMAFTDGASFTEHRETRKPAPRGHQAVFAFLAIEIKFCPRYHFTLGAQTPLIHIHCYLQKFKEYLFTLDNLFGGSKLINFSMTVQQLSLLVSFPTKKKTLSRKAHLHICSPRIHRVTN